VPSASRIATSKISRLPSLCLNTACAVTLRPKGVAATWRSSTRVPTVVIVVGMRRVRAITVAASASASTLGVPNTGTSPEPRDWAVSAWQTVVSTRPEMSSTVAW
jgi:hypothetical protein